MAEISDSVMVAICAAARKIRYGSVTIQFTEGVPTVDIVVEEKMRIANSFSPCAGTPTKVKKVFVVHRDS
jgi:hypothetical protein